jgi:hypothetical protein
MRDSGSDIVTALSEAPSKGLVPLRFVTIWARSNDTGEPVRFGFWSDPVPASISIANRLTGDLETRDFVGGVLEQCAPVKLRTGLQITSWNFSLNALHPSVLDLLGNHDLHLAEVEYHRVPGSTRSRRPVDDPPRRFFGRVDGAPQPTPAAGGTASVTISCVNSIGTELVTINPKKRAEVARSGDEQMQYVQVAHAWEIDWGQASGEAK